MHNYPRHCKTGPETHIHMHAHTHIHPTQTGEVTLTPAHVNTHTGNDWLRQQKYATTEPFIYK